MSVPRAHFPRRILAGGLLLALAGCSVVPSWLGGGRSISRMSIVSEADANLNGATAVDLVMTTSDDASAALLKLSAHDWFQRRAQLLRDYPEDIKIASWELAPGQALQNADVDSPAGLKDAIVFAGYATPGDHRLRLGDDSRVRLTLGDTDLRLGP
jgi:type VI secretion system protein